MHVLFIVFLLLRRPLVVTFGNLVQQVLGEQFFFISNISFEVLELHLLQVLKVKAYDFLPLRHFFLII